MCIYLNPASVYIWRIYDTFETILRKILTFRSATTNYSDKNVSRLLIGAPEADARQPGVHKGGAVYKCSAQRSGDCEIIPFDKNGNVLYKLCVSLIFTLKIMCFEGTTMAKNGQAYDNKSGQWLGSLVASSGADGTIMVNIQ